MPRFFLSNLADVGNPAEATDFLELDDKKILVGGVFNVVRWPGGNDDIAYDYLFRIMPNGELDESFNPGTGPNGPVYQMAFTPEGQIIIVGDFTSYNGQRRNRIALINADGSLDSSVTFGSGVNDAIWSVDVQPDGKILVGGDFTVVRGANVNRISRFRANGDRDLGFNTGAGANARVRVIKYQPNGDVLIGGEFDSVSGNTRRAIARLLSTGTLDNSFMNNIPGLTGAINFDPKVSALETVAGGKILVAGEFFRFEKSAGDFVSAYGLLRLNPDGALDESFPVAFQRFGRPGTVWDLATLRGGKILVSGQIRIVDDFAVNGVARLFSNGQVDRCDETTCVPISTANGSVAVICF